MHYIARLFIALVTLLGCSSLYAGGTVSKAPEDATALDAPPSPRAPVVPVVRDTTPIPPPAVTSAPDNPAPLPQPVPVVSAPPAAPVVQTTIIAPPSPPVQAPRNYYLDVGVGPLRYSNSTSIGLVNCQVDNRDTGYKIFAGRRLTDHIGIEAGYVNLGHQSASGCAMPAATVAAPCNACQAEDQGHAKVIALLPANAVKHDDKDFDDGHSIINDNPHDDGKRGNPHDDGKSGNPHDDGYSGNNGKSNDDGHSGNGGQANGDDHGKDAGHPVANTNPASRNLHVQGLSLAGTVSTQLPVSALTAFAKAGVFFWHSNSSFNDQSSSASGASPVYGVGLEYNVTAGTAVRLEAERYVHVGESAFQTRPNVDMTSISLVKHF